MSTVEYCPNCDNTPRLKQKCKVCLGKGVVRKGKNGYFKIKKKK